MTSLQRSTSHDIEKSFYKEQLTNILIDYSIKVFKINVNSTLPTKKLLQQQPLQQQPLQQQPLQQQPLQQQPLQQQPLQQLLNLWLTAKNRTESWSLDHKGIE